MHCLRVHTVQYVREMEEEDEVVGGWVGGWCYQALIGAPNLDTLKEESRAWESLWAGKGRCSTEVCGHR